MRTLPLLVATALAGACGGVVQETQADGPVDDSGVDAKAPLGTPLGALVGACPAARPMWGVSCDAVAGVICEYGDDPDWGCNDLAYCSPPETCTSAAACARFAWAPLDESPPRCPSPALVSGPDCPASHADAVRGGACSKEGEVCVYAEGLCACSSALGGWACATPAAPCPPIRPRVGSACSVSDLLCDYGVCPGYPDDEVFECSGPTTNGKVSGFWSPGSPLCLGSGGSGGK
jgi:hypothetical protein